VARSSPNQIHRVWLIDQQQHVHAIHAAQAKQVLVMPGAMTKPVLMIQPALLPATGVGFFNKVNGHDKIQHFQWDGHDSSPECSKAHDWTIGYSSDTQRRLLSRAGAVTLWGNNNKITE
jgi:hypothetical protein